MTSRDYQTEADAAAFREWGNGVRSTLIVVPTGGGKTVIATGIIQKFQPKRTMFIAHRIELLKQARKTIEEHAGLECGIEQGDLMVQDGLIKVPVVLAMVQTLVAKNGMTKRMGRFNPMDFDLLVIDEFHHAVAKSYRDIENYFMQNPNLKVLGLTATPDRADEEALSQVCQSVAYRYEIQDAIRDGWLVDVKQYRMQISGLDFSHIKTVAGELNQGELSKVMESEGNIHGVVEGTLETMYDLEPKHLHRIPVETWGDYLRSLGTPPKRTLVFTVSVLQAETLSNIFNRVMPGQWGWVCGKTADEARADLLRRYSLGDIVGVVNCNCLSEGFDNPGVELIVDAYATKSRSLYAQRCGRSLRPLPGIVDGLPTAEDRRAAIAASAKPYAIVLDPVGNSGRHKLVCTADILGGKVTDKVKQFAIKLADNAARPISMTDALVEAEKMEQAELLKRKALEEARKAKLVARANFSMQEVSPFDVFNISPVKPRAIDTGRVLSTKQRNILLKNGVNPDALPYAQSRQLLNEMFSRWGKNYCGLKLARQLRKKGLPINVTTEEAVRHLRGYGAEPKPVMTGGRGMPDDVEQVFRNW
jgi:superfamily II DNA or RNA helicase